MDRGPIFAWRVGVGSNTKCIARLPRLLESEFGRQITVHDSYLRLHGVMTSQKSRKTVAATLRNCLLDSLQ
jgi:hypothetical protein